MNQSAFQQVIREAIARLGWSIFGFVLALSVGYLYSEEFLFLFAFPIIQKGMQAEFLCTKITEAFQTYLKVSLIVSLYVSAPLLIYQTWCFFIPSCTKRQRHIATQWLILSATLFCTGFLLAFCFVVPTAWAFFLKQCSTSISLVHLEFQPRVYDYTLLLFRIMLFFACCSQVPLFVAWLIKQRVQTTRQQSQGRRLFCHRKKILFLSICLAALLSPPDIWSQLIVLLPYYLFIEIVIFYEILLGEYNLVG